jgi:N-acetylmuramoyl-L-alanine amidase
MRTPSQPAAWLPAALLLCLSGPLLAQSPARSASQSLVLQEVRHWTTNGITRVAVQLSGPAEIRRDRLHKPDRYFFDFQQTTTARKGMQTIPVNEALVRQIRIAEAKPGVARVVLDLSGNAELSTEELSNPYRLVIEIRRPGTSPAPPPANAPTPIISAAPSKTTRPFVLPSGRGPVLAAAILPIPPVLPLPAALRRLPYPPLAKIEFPPYRKPRQPVVTAAAPASKPTSVERPSTARNSVKPTGPRPSGANSMTRALGLKIRRVVLDPGHGGHDQGSSGPTGLLEKELVLDVALLLGELISSQLGSEVVYTRDDDRFIPLEERTRIANQSRADLFISIHANSSTVRSVSGVETYYLSFTNAKDALEVAARENATSERSVFELRDLLQKIALQEKIDESRDFATRVNSSLYRVWGNSATARNRGVKKAPFVVLIGASMPSILTEIGFLSNPREERELRKPETRQKIAEALFNGLSQYADSLARYAVARRAQGTE